MPPTYEDFSLELQFTKTKYGPHSVLCHTATAFYGALLNTKQNKKQPLKHIMLQMKVCECEQRNKIFCLLYCSLR